MSDPLTASAASPAMFQHVERPEFAIKPFVAMGDEIFTYGDLRERMARTGLLFSEYGVRPGDRIVICSEQDIDVISLYLSAMRHGVTPALIDPSASAAEAVALVRAAQARALFADDRVLGLAGLRAELLPGGQAFAMAAATAPAGDLGSDDGGRRYPAALSRYSANAPLPATIATDTSAFILFTSGTTSRPKGVEVSHAALAAHMATMHRQYGYGEDSRIINGLPLHHSDGINHGAVNVMAAGATLYRTGVFSVQNLPKILDMVARLGITHMITVPTVIALIARLGDEFSNAFRTPSFRFISSTAGPLDERLWRSFEERFGAMVVNSYGLTETVCEGLYCGPTPGTRRIGTVGKPVDIDVRIVDAKGRDVAPGEMGELILRGSCVMKGYFNAPEETAAVIRDGWLHTGDLAVCDADGFYTITGRKKNVIISGGINVYPEDVSLAITRMPAVAEAVTLGVPDETWGERVVSCVVPEPGVPLTAEQVIEFCRAHMSREKVPSHVFLVSELPRGSAGKVALPQVRNKVADLLASSAVAAAASPVAGDTLDTVRRRVLELAAQSFKTPVAELSPDSEPESTAGWNSLAHMDFLVALESAFGLKISPSDMLAIVTLGDAIDYVRAKFVER